MKQSMLSIVVVSHLAARRRDDALRAVAVEDAERLRDPARSREPQGVRPASGAGLAPREVERLPVRDGLEFLPRDAGMLHFADTSRREIICAGEFHQRNKGAPILT